MEFKENKSFDTESRFTDSMGRFLTDDAMFISREEEKSSDVKRDAGLENVVRHSDNIEVPPDREETLAKKKEQKKAATKVSIRNVLKGKKDYLDNKKEEEESSGDAFVDGRKGMAGKVLDAINPMSYLKKLLAKFLAAIAPYLLMYTGLVLVVIVVVTILFQVLWPLLQIRNALDGVLDMFSGRQEWFMSTAMSEDEIESYLSEISGSERQKAVVRYALEQVGGWYDSDSLVYDSWMTVEKDLSFGQGYPLYAEELASEMEARNMSVDAGRIMPGDLIFYGDMSGGYLGIYHVAIYAGNGHVVEAMGNVVLMKMQTYDAVMVARPR